MPTTFRLREALDNAGISQKELQRRSGVSYTTINAMVKNKTRQVALDTLDALAGALGVTSDALIADSRKTKRRRR